MNEPSVLVMVVLKHDQAMDLEERNRILTEKGWWNSFPPEGCEVRAWHFALGLGHVVVLSVPNDRIPELNVEIQRSCWGAFTSELYLSYDFSDMRSQIAARIAAESSTE